MKPIDRSAYAIVRTFIAAGAAVWDWWNANNVHGVDFKSGVNTATYRYYIDFASKHGIEYIILDRRNVGEAEQPLVDSLIALGGGFEVLFDQDDILVAKRLTA